MRTWIRNLSTASFGIALTSGIASAQVAPPRTPAQPAQGQARTQPGADIAADVQAGEVPGPIDSLNELEETGRMAFKMADTNNDGQISQKEAVDVGNLMVGGFFFRADQNGDGVLSKDEAAQARQSLYAQQPLLKYVMERGKAAAKANPDVTNADPSKVIGNILDSNDDQKIQASELRQAVQSGVQMMFAAGDTNRDNQLSPTEINAAMIGAVRTASQAAFNQADADHNGSLSRPEFDKAIVEPANFIFSLLDVNGDGQITQQEGERVQNYMGSQVRHLMVPEPANSAMNLIRTGTPPSAAAPAPAAAPPPLR